MSRTNKVLYFSLLGLIIGLAANPAFAYGEEISSSLMNLLNWVTKVLGVIVIAFGIAWGGLRASFDDHAWSTALKVIIGGILCLSSYNIAKLLLDIFG